MQTLATPIRHVADAITVIERSARFARNVNDRTVRECLRENDGITSRRRNRRKHRVLVRMISPRSGKIAFMRARNRSEAAIPHIAIQHRENCFRQR